MLEGSVGDLGMQTDGQGLETLLQVPHHQTQTLKPTRQNLIDVRAVKPLDSTGESWRRVRVLVFLRCVVR